MASSLASVDRGVWTLGALQKSGFGREPSNWIRAPHRVRLRLTSSRCFQKFAASCTREEEVYQELVLPELRSWRANPKSANKVLSRSSPDVASVVLSLMLKGQVQLDVFHFTAVIGACDRSSRWNLALHLLERMPEKFSVVPDTVARNAAISALEKAGRWCLACSILAAMPKARAMPDEVSYNAAISGFSKASQWQLAFDVLHETMPCIRVSPGEITCNAAITSCEKGLQWQLALRLLEESMPRMSLIANRISYSSLISACEKSGQWKLAVGTLWKMSKLKVSPN
ncbi:unnamed protein product, partial [Polarella glacialis]